MQRQRRPRLPFRQLRDSSLDSTGLFPQEPGQWLSSQATEGAFLPGSIHSLELGGPARPGPSGAGEQWRLCLEGGRVLC